jgi:hypothetical protein
VFGKSFGMDLVCIPLSKMYPVNELVKV